MPCYEAWGELDEVRTMSNHFRSGQGKPTATYIPATLIVCICSLILVSSVQKPGAWVPLAWSLSHDRELMDHAVPRQTERKHSNSEAVPPHAGCVPRQQRI